MEVQETSSRSLLRVQQGSKRGQTELLHFAESAREHVSSDDERPQHCDSALAGKRKPGRGRNQITIKSLTRCRQDDQITRGIEGKEAQVDSSVEAQ